MKAAGKKKLRNIIKKSSEEKIEITIIYMEEKDYGYDNMPELRRTNIG